MFFSNNGNQDCSCIWLILIILLLMCCCGSQNSSGCRCGGNHETCC